MKAAAAGRSRRGASLESGCARTSWREAKGAAPAEMSALLLLRRLRPLIERAEDVDFTDVHEAMTDAELGEGAGSRDLALGPDQHGSVQARLVDRGQKLVGARPGL